ncbi:MAG: hypothetical protein K6T74_15525 [Geminicoccaceae bacterium]|nr:hypothetical protein [Geminicoccaceae bacterium]
MATRRPEAPEKEPAGEPGSRRGEGRRPLLWPTAEAAEPERRRAELRRDWQARMKPIDEAERAAVDAIVGTVRRRALLGRVEERLLEGLAEGRPDPAMPSLATLSRHAGRIEKDRLLAERELGDLYRLRPVPLSRPRLDPERLEWLAAHLRARAVESAEALSRVLDAHLAAPVAAPAPDRSSRPAEPAEPSVGSRSSGAADGAVGREATPVREPGPDRGTGGGRRAPLDGLAAAFAGTGPVIGTGRRGTWLASTSALPTLAASAVR